MLWCGSPRLIRVLNGGLAYIPTGATLDRMRLSVAPAIS